jgi:parallel beta-helix repeat protein
MNNFRIDPIFRQAISYAIDYETIITDIRDDQAIRSKSPIPNGILYANDGFEFATLNIPKARTILRDNEKPNLPIGDIDQDWIDVAESEQPVLTIKYPTIVGSWINDLALLVVKNLTLIGIMVDLVEIEGNFFDYFSYLESGEADMFYLGWGPDFNDPSNFVNNFFSKNSPYNLASVDDDYLEQLMDTALIELDPSVREGLYDQIQEYLVEDLMPFCYLLVDTYDTAWNKKLENYPINSLQIKWFFDCTWDNENTIPGYNHDQPIEDLKNIEPERNIEDAISSGLEWLVEEQADDGGWNQHYTNDRVGISAFALLKLEERAFELEGIEGPLDPDYDYSDNVMAGLNFILENAHLMDTDSDPGEDALFFAYEPDENYHHFVYETSVAMLAIAASEQPDQTVDDSISLIGGWSYEEVLQFALNYLIYAQRDNELFDDGGWGYGAPGQLPEWWGEDRSDNSNTGWAVLALIYAQNKFGLYIPDFVKDNLNVWIDFIQGEDGGSGYSWPNNWENVLKTGNLLFEMALVGDDIESPRVQAAIQYIEEHWNDKNQDPGWLVNYQAMYTLMKGFESMGINTITVNNEKIDWFEDISFIIVESQRYDGSWPSDLYGDPTLTTAWALLTLEKVAESPTFPVYVDVKPGSWPNPINTISKGLISIAICGTQDFDIMEIDPATIQLHVGGKMETVSPLSWSYEDVATPYTGDEGGGHDQDVDGFTDLVLKFDIQEMINSLDLSDYAGETIPLVLDGNFFIETGGAPIKGKDYVWILEIVLKPFIIDDTGNGDYTWKEARKQPWCKGAGTIKNPYIIENIAINGEGSIECLVIRDSNVYFIIRDSRFYNSEIIEGQASAALVVENALNGKIINNDCSYNDNTGIGIRNSCTKNSQSGIFLWTDVKFNTINENICSENLWGITLSTNADNNDITNNICLDNNLGILFSDGSDENDILGNTIKNNLVGVYFHWELGLSHCIQNQIHNNDFIGNGVPWAGWLYDNFFYDNHIEP